MTIDQINMKVVRSIHYVNNANWNHKVNLYSYNTIYFILDGDGFIKIEEQTMPLEKGNIYFIPANTMFQCWCKSYIHKLYIEVSVELVPGYDIFSFTGVQKMPYPIDQIHVLVDLNEKQDLKSELHMRGELTKIISCFMEEDYTVPDNKIFQFQAIIADIDKNLTSQLKVIDIAEKYNWNPSVLSRSFKKAFGYTLKRYIELLLVNRIKLDLRFTDKKLKEIAWAYGFCDQYYMSNFFKKHEMISPSKYRMENK